MFHKPQSYLFLRLIFLITLFFSALFNIYISASPGLQGFGIYPWYTTYEYGFIRRALVGTLFQILIYPFSFKNDPIQTHSAILTIHILMCYAIAFLNCKIFWVSTKEKSYTNLFSCFLVSFIFISSFFYKTTVNITGYIDTITTAAILFILLYFLKYNTLLWIVAFIFTFAHEQILFFWIPFVFASLYFSYQKDKKINLKIFIPFCAVFLFKYFEMDKSNLHHLFTFSGMDKPLLQTIITQQLNNDPLSLFKYMLQQIYDRQDSIYIAGPYYMLPSFLIIACGIHNMDSVSLKIKYILISISGSFILLFAWDLWRILSYSTLTAYSAFFLFNKPISFQTSDHKIPSHPFKTFFILLVSFLILLSPASRIYFGGGKIDNFHYPFILHDTFPFKLAVKINNTISFKNHEFSDFELTNPGIGFLLPAIPAVVPPNTLFERGANALNAGKYHISIKLNNKTQPFKTNISLHKFGKRHVFQDFPVNYEHTDRIDIQYEFSDIDAATAGFVLKIDPVDHEYTVESIRLIKQ